MTSYKYIFLLIILSNYAYSQPRIYTQLRRQEISYITSLLEKNTDKTSQVQRQFNSFQNKLILSCVAKNSVITQACMLEIIKDMDKLSITQLTDFINYVEKSVAGKSQQGSALRKSMISGRDKPQKNYMLEKLKILIINMQENLHSEKLNHKELRKIFNINIANITKKYLGKKKFMPKYTTILLKSLKDKTEYWQRDYKLRKKLDNFFTGNLAISRQDAFTEIYNISLIKFKILEYQEIYRNLSIIIKTLADRDSFENYNLMSGINYEKLARQITSYHQKLSFNKKVQSENQQNITRLLKQVILQDPKTQDSRTTIFAPIWLEKFTRNLKQISPKNKIIYPWGQEVLPTEKLNLKQLIMMARNEYLNTSGVINFDLYRNINRHLVLDIKDLVRQVIIIGSDKIIENKQQIEVVDLAGLQFQTKANSGRMVLRCPKNNLPQGFFEEELFKQIVGKKRENYDKVYKDKSGRYLKLDYLGIKNCFFDSGAYKKFVEQDFILAARSLNAYLDENITNRDYFVNFKFLAYGTGFFAAGLPNSIKNKLRLFISQGVYQALLKIADKKYDISRIKGLELPYIQELKNKEHPESQKILANIKSTLAKIENLCEEYNIPFYADKLGALQPRKFEKKYNKDQHTATTNAADPHAMMGNEMGRTSVDARIAHGIMNQGNKFNPYLNINIREHYINLSK